PNFESARAATWIEALVVAFEGRRVVGSESRIGEAMVPDALERRGDHGDVFAMLEHRVLVWRNAQPRKFRRVRGELLHFYTADVIEFTRVAGVMDDPVCSPADLPRNVAEMRREICPLRHDPGVGVLIA